MPKWVRKVLALIAGVIAGGITIAVVEKIGHSLVEGQALFGIAVVGLGLAAFIGGIVAISISKQSVFVWVIAGVLAALSLINVFSFEHPIWFVPVAFICLGIGAYLAIRLHNSMAKVA